MRVGYAFSPLLPEDLALDGLECVSWGHVPGTLLDDGGFPACVQGAPGRIRGWLHRLDPDRLDAVLAAMDLQHGTDGRHVRTIVRLMDGGSLAWAWHWTGPRDLPVVGSGDWRAHLDPRLL